MKQLFALVLACGLCHGALAGDVYVSAAGNDANPGTQQRPVASLQRARDLARAARKAKPDEPTTVWIGAGDYRMEMSLELNASDGGTAAAPATWRAGEGAHVRLLGGRVVTGFRPVTDPAVLARLPETARSAVRVADLKAMGITDFGQLRSRGFGRPTAPAHMELFFDHRPMTLARWPNEGSFEHIAGFPEGAGGGDGHGGSLGKLSEGFTISTDRPSTWKSLDDVWVHGYWAWDWANSYEKVASIDLKTKLVKTAPPYGQYGFRKGQRIFFLNILEELDQPGEYYVDRTAGRLYFWPPEPMAQKETLVSVLEKPAIAIRNASHLTIRGLRIEAVRGDGITLSNCTDCTIAGCVLDNIGDYAARVDGGHDDRVLACDVFNCGDGGVTLSGGNRQTLTPGNQAVENCRFVHQGRWSKCYVPAVLVDGVGNRVSHNVIHEHPHCAILFGGNDHVIEFNEIYHVALETGDVGAIYMGRDYTYRGNIIRDNFIHDTGGVGMGSMGVYMDDCVSGTLITSNIFYKVQRAVFLGGGRDHQVLNNLFVDCDPAVALDGRGLDKSPTWHSMVYRTMKQRLERMPRELYVSRYPAIEPLFKLYTADNGIAPEGNVIAHNVCQGKWLQINWHAKPDMVDVRDNVVAGDVGVGSIEKLDFRLKPGSPAFKAGFKAIPFNEIGLQNDAWRQQGTVEADR